MTKYYAVRKGRTTGIFTSTAECRASVEGYRGAQYDVFEMEEDAHSYLGALRDNTNSLVAYTDGSWNGLRYGWSVVIEEGDPAERRGRGYFGSGAESEYAPYGNIVGEVTAALKAMEYAVSRGYTNLLIRYDYTGVAEWGEHPFQGDNRVAREYSASVERLKKLGLHVLFEKVRAHTGDWGNECADRLAKYGAAGENEPVAGAGIAVGADLLPAAAPPESAAAYAAIRRPSPMAILLDRTAEKACITAIQNMAALLDAMYGNEVWDPDSVSMQTDAALSRAVPGYERLRDPAPADVQPTKAEPNPAALSSEADKRANEMSAAKATILAVRAAAKLYAARRSAKLRKTHVADKCGIPLTTLTRLERGNADAADFSCLQKIAAVLGRTDLSELQQLAELASSLEEAVKPREEQSTCTSPEAPQDTRPCCSPETLSGGLSDTVPALREARRRAGLRQTDIAKKCGISVRTLSRLERGLLPNAEAELVRAVWDAVRGSTAADDLAVNPEDVPPAQPTAGEQCTEAAYNELADKTIAQLQQRREDSGIATAHVAQACGIPVNYVELIEHGTMRPVSVATLRQIAEAVGCPEIPQLAALADMDSVLWPGH